jgi:Protein of unknown function (DUF3551)
MQSALLPLRILSVAIVLIAGAAYAQNLPWCAILDTNGTTQCAYYTQQHCLETLSGIGGECIADPSAGPPTLAPSAPLPDATLGPPLDLDPGPPPGLDGAAGPGPPP